MLRFTVCLVWIGLWHCLPMLAAEIDVPPVAHGPMSDEIRFFEADHNGLARFYDLSWSPVCFERNENLYSEWLNRLGRQEVNGFDRQDLIDYLLLRAELQFETTHIARERKQLAAMDFFLPFRAPVQDLERTRWQMTALDPQSAAGIVSAIPEQVRKLRERLERGKKDEKPKPDEPADNAPLKMEPLLAKRAANATDAIRQTLGNWFNYYEGSQPEFSWWAKRPCEEANKALEEYAKFMREEVAGMKGKDEDPLLGESLGAEALAVDLAHEMITYTPGELLAIGEREFAWCEARMKETAKEMGLGEDWKAALAKVKALHEPPGKQDEFVAAQAHDAIDFVTKHNLVTVPKFCEETWRITMMSTDAQRSIPYAAYNGQQMMVAYPREDMKYDDKLMSMRGNNKHFTRIVTAHEIIPGHHLQAYYAARYHPYRQMFSTPFFVEGWAVYWETRLWDLGYARNAEDKIGMLFWRMHRCARILVTLKFHLGQMTPKEMVDFLVERVGHERFGATSEVRRFIAGDFSPLYQCGYMLGALQLRALHHEVVDAGKMTEQQFNDAVLHFGPIPVELIRAGMLNTPLTRDFKAAWRFADK